MMLLIKRRGYTHVFESYTKPPMQRVSGALITGIKRPGREADHSHPSSAQVKNAWRYTSTQLIIRLHGVVLC